MHGRVAKARDSIEVIARRVSFVAIESIAGIAIVQLEHDPIARDFGHDRGRRNRGAASITVDDRTLRHHQIRHLKRVDQDEIGERDEAEDRALHRAQGSLMNVDGIDFRGIGGGNSPGNRSASNLLVEPDALERGHGFRIADPGDVSLRIEDYRRGDDRPCKAAAADLVDTGNQVEPQSPD